MASTADQLVRHGPGAPLFRRLETMQLGVRPLVPVAYDLVPRPDAHVAPGHRHEIAVVVLTQANRPAELARAIASVRAQQGVDLQLVMVLNGTRTGSASDVMLPELDAADRLIVLPENVGIPGGRNLGAAAADASLLLFLDDDAELLGPSVLAGVVDRFARGPDIGAMAIRLVDEDGVSQRRHVPRLGARSAERPGRVTHFIGAACVVRTDVFEDLGGFDRRFFYAMEESDLSWRLLDSGWSIWYSADLTAFHPHTAPSRHPGHVLLTARNRMWAAWRSLPLPMWAAYVLTWYVLAVLRGGSVRQVSAGYRQAWSTRPGRRPMSWRTVARMTVLGRPPVV